MHLNALFLMTDDQVVDMIYDTLKTYNLGDPYSEDGSFAANSARLPLGLCAMAATHYLDISLQLDSVTWHFGNFGERALVEQTEQGLRMLGLGELADVFRQASELMLPAIAAMPTGVDFADYLLSEPLRESVDRLDRSAWQLNEGEGQLDAITQAWVLYAREHPDFSSEKMLTHLFRANLR